MKITIIGGGNIGTQFAAHSASKGNETVIYTSKPELFAKRLSVVNENGDILCEGDVFATNDIEVACKSADVIFVTVPAFCMKETAKKMYPYVERGTKIGLIPGTGGGECCFKEFLEKQCVVFGLQRVPSVARLTSYGHQVKGTGYRAKLHIASLPKRAAQDCAAIMTSLFDVPCDIISEYLALTLTPSNPILHTTRLYTLFQDYQKGRVYPIIPLFYEEWTDETSRILFACDEELQKMCVSLKEFDLSDVVSLKVHYESDAPEKLTKKIQSIKGFKGITTPQVVSPNGDGVLPDLNSRYFVADFSFGLEIISQIAKLVHFTQTESISKVMQWYESVKIRNEKFNYADYGIINYQQFVDFYKGK